MIKRTVTNYLYTEKEKAGKAVFILFIVPVEEELSKSKLQVEYSPEVSLTGKAAYMVKGNLFL